MRTKHKLIWLKIWVVWATAYQETYKMLEWIGKERRLARNIFHIFPYTWIEMPRIFFFLFRGSFGLSAFVEKSSLICRVCLSRHTHHIGGIFPLSNSDAWVLWIYASWASKGQQEWSSSNFMRIGIFSPYGSHIHNFDLSKNDLCHLGVKFFTCFLSFCLERWATRSAMKSSKVHPFLEIEGGIQWTLKNIQSDLISPILSKWDWILDILTAPSQN